MPNLFLVYQLQHQQLLNYSSINALFATCCQESSLFTHFDFDTSIRNILPSKRNITYSYLKYLQNHPLISQLVRLYHTSAQLCIQIYHWLANANLLVHFTKRRSFIKSLETTKSTQTNANQNNMRCVCQELNPGLLLGRQLS